MIAYRETYAEINLSNLKDNIKLIAQHCQKPMMAIVKADAYGHGALKIAQIASRFNEIAMFGVATLGEAIALRDGGIEKDILVLGAIPVDDVEVAVKNHISLCVFSLDYLSHLIKNIDHGVLKIHLKVDTGMNRLGFKNKEEFEKALQFCQRSSHLQIDGVFTHYGAADEPNDTYYQQFQRFQTIVGEHQFKYIHAANTAGALYYREDYTNLVRIGIGLYGVEPNGKENSPLKQVMSLKSKVVMVKKIQKDEMVGYGFTYQAENEQYIATVPIGYADGLIRKNQNRMVYIHDKYYPIVGRVCMDQMMLCVDESVSVQDEVEIFGEHISLNQMAKELETIPYEITCLLSARVERRYLDAD